MNFYRNIDPFKTLLFFFVIIFLFHFLLISFFAHESGGDSGIWHYIGWHWFNFKDIQDINILDNKPPGIHYLYYLSSKYFDVNFLPLKLVSIVTKIATGFIIFRASILLTKKKDISYIVILIYYLLLGWEQLDNYQPVFTEVFTSFFSTLSIYIYLKYKNIRSLILSGIFIGLGVYFKQTILVFFFGFLVLIFYNEGNKKINSIFTIIASFLFTFLFLFGFLIYEGLNYKGLIYQFIFFLI